MCSPRTRGAESGRASPSRPLLTRPSPDVRGGAERNIAAAGDGPDLVEQVASGMSRAPLALARPVSLVAVVSPLQRFHRFRAICSGSAIERVALALHPLP